MSEKQPKAALTGGLFSKSSSSPFGGRAGNLFQPVGSFLGALQLSRLFQPSVFTQVVCPVWSVVLSCGCVTLIWVVMFLSSVCYVLCVLSQSRWLCYLTPCQMFSFFVCVHVCTCTLHRKLPCVIRAVSKSVQRAKLRQPYFGSTQTPGLGLCFSAFLLHLFKNSCNSLFHSSLNSVSISEDL